MNVLKINQPANEPTIHGRIGLRPYRLDAILAALALGACFAFYSGINDYVDGLCGGLGGIIFYAGVFQLPFMLGLPLVIFVHMLWRCLRDGIWGLVIRATLIAAIPTLMFLMGGPAVDERADRMHLKGFASWFRLQQPDVAAIREWLKTARLPEGRVEREDYPLAIGVMYPRLVEVLKDGCVELEWSQRDTGAWGVTIAPAEHFPQEEEYKVRMAAGMYTEVCGNGEAMRYKQYMIQLAPGVYAWLSPVREPPDPFPSESVEAH